MQSFWRLAGSFVPLLIGNTSCQQDSVAPPGAEPASYLDSGAQDGDEADAGPATGRGFVVVDTEADQSTYATAAFSKTGFPGQPNDAHGCLVQDSRELARDEEPYPAAESAGRIEVTAGARSATLDVVTENGTVAGYSRTKLSGGASPLSPDVSIHVEAQGATIPAFELEVLPATELEFTTSPSDGVAVGQPLEVRWSSSNADYVIARLDAGAVTVQCNSEASKGSIVIPSEHVAKVAADATDGVKLTIQATRTKVARFGDVAVSLDHRAYSTPVKLPVL